MLEIEDKDKKSHSSKEEKIIKNQEQVSEEYKKPKDFKIVIQKDEFSKNLERHNLHQKINTIEKKKVEIGLEVILMKKRGWIKIGIGILFIVLSLNRFYYNQMPPSTATVEMVNGDDVTTITTTTGAMTHFNYIILGLLFVLFGVLYFTGDKKDKKDKK